MKNIIANAPRGVSVITLDNEEKAVFINGVFIACSDSTGQRESIPELGKVLADTLGEPLRQFELSAPGNDELGWQEVTEGMLNWGNNVTLSRHSVRPVVECLISHLTVRDSFRLKQAAILEEDKGFIMDTDIGYLIRLDAHIHSLLILKRMGLSKPARRLIAACVKRGVSMIHFSAVGDAITGFETFDW